MNHNENLPAQYNPYKATRKTTKRDMSGVNAFWERTKATNPALYQKHAKEKAAIAAQRLIIDALLDTPEGIKMTDEIYDDMVKSDHQRLTSELATLGLDGITTKRDIRNAYRRKARKLHPDVGGDAEAFKQLHAAYRTLLKEAHE